MATVPQTAGSDQGARDPFAASDRWVWEIGPEPAPECGPPLVSDEDRAHWAGWCIGFDGSLGAPPDGLTEGEREAWRAGWEAGYAEAIAAMERAYRLDHPDPDPWNEARGAIAGHPGFEAP